LITLWPAHFGALIILVVQVAMSAWRPLLRIRNAQHRPYSAAAASTSPAKQFRGCGAEASGRESEFV